MCKEDSMNTEKRVPRKRWIILIPVLFFANLMSFMTRQVISIALVGGMQDAIGMAASMVGFVSGITSIGVMILSVPAGTLAQKGKIKWAISAAILTWSICTFLCGYVTRDIHLVILRFILGVAEGMVIPGVTTLIPYWFPEEKGERARASSAFMSATGIATLLVSPIAGVLIQLYDWRVMFRILGLISALAFVLWTVFVQERPEKAKWLPTEECRWITETIVREREISRANMNHSSVGKKAGVRDLLRNKYVWVLSIYGFCMAAGQFGYSLWVPSYIKEITGTNAAITSFINVLPSFCVLLGLWFFTFVNPFFKSKRTPLLLSAFLFGAAFFVAMAIGMRGGVVLAIIMICLVHFFFQAYMPSYYTIPSLILPPEIEGTARGTMNMVA